MRFFNQARKFYDGMKNKHDFSIFRLETWKLRDIKPRRTR
jgi:hypothetical protein